MLDGVRAKHIFDAVHDFQKTTNYSKNPKLAGKSVVCCQGTIEFVSNTPEEAYKKGLALLSEDLIWFVVTIPFMSEIVETL